MLLLLPLSSGQSGLAWGAACALIFLPAMLIPGGQPPKASLNDRGLMAQLAAQRPEFVFIGNSTVESCSDHERMSELLGGRPVANVITYGGFTAFDYIMLKSLVAPADINPKSVFFFFRGTLLTKPRERTEAVFAEALPYGSEPVLRQVLAGQFTWAEKVAAGLKNWLRVSGRQTAACEALRPSRPLADHPALGGGKGPQTPRPPALRHQRPFRPGAPARGGGDDMVAREKAREKDGFDFDALVEGSFVPNIIKLCREMGARPIFSARPGTPHRQRPPARRSPPDPLPGPGPRLSGGPGRGLS